MKRVIPVNRNVLQIVNGLPPRIKEVHDNAYELAYGELNLQYIDSSVYLLAIFDLGPDDASSKWLHAIGLERDGIIRFIKRDFNERAADKMVRTGWGKKAPVMPVLGYTQAANKMFYALERMPHPSYVSSSPYVIDTLHAVVLSASLTVEQIFGSVGCTLVYVRSLLQHPSNADRGALIR